MKKTLKEIAEDLNIPKQKVYRYVKANCINEAHQSGQTKYYDEVAQKQIKEGLVDFVVHQKTTSEPHHEAIYDVLIEQLKIKDAQIEDLNKRLEQALYVSVQTASNFEAKIEEKTLKLELKEREIEELQAQIEEEKNKKWWQKIKK